MEAKIERLKRRSEFLRVASAGGRWAAAGVVVQAAAGGSETDPRHPAIRVGFTCSKKVGNAVARNRARRRLRAAAAQVLPEVGVAGHDYVLIGRTETLNRPFALLLDDLRQSVRKAERRRTQSTTPVSRKEPA